MINPKKPIHTRMQDTDLSHLVGKPELSRVGWAKRKKQAPVIDYAPGYFTALMRANNWPPRFQSAMPEDKKQPAGMAHEGREKRVANGSHYATGTIVMAGTPKHKALGWM